MKYNYFNCIFLYNELILNNLPGSFKGSGDTSWEKYIDTSYRDSWFLGVNNDMKINRLINPKVYVNPTQAKISFDSSVPFWAKTYINDAYESAYNKNSNYSNDVYLTYSGQKLFKVNGSNGNYSLAPITKDLNEAKKIIESIDNNEELSASFAPDYNSKNTTIYNIIYAYYKQGQDIFDDWSEYRINPNDLLWVEGSYSYANQLLSNVSKFNPSLSNRTDSSSFIKDNLTFQAVKAAFSPDPSERFVFDIFPMIFNQIQRYLQSQVSF